MKRSRRATRMRLTVNPGGSVIVTVPERTHPDIVITFIQTHAQWIERAVERMSAFIALPARGRASYHANKERARTLIRERLLHWNGFYGFTYHRVSIKDTKRIWGSCSIAGNLNFSYAILFLPQRLQDYIIVHELCHLKEHNHSERFWALVAQTFPDHRAARRELRRYIPRQ